MLGRQIIFIVLMAFSIQEPLFGYKKPSQGKEQKTNDIKPIMHGIFANLKEIYGLSLDLKELADSKNKSQITNYFSSLQGYVSKIEKFSEADNVFLHTGKSLAKDVSQASSMFEQNSYPETAFTVRHMVENCVSCHTRQKAKSFFPVTIISKDQEKNLNPYELARLKIASRQFPEAQIIFEKIIKSNKYSFQELLGSGVLIDYLKLVLRVENNVNAAINSLNTFLVKNKLKSETSEMLNKWLEDLNSLQATNYFTKTSNLIEAKKLLAQAGGRTQSKDFPLNNTILYVAASASLQDLVFQSEKSKEIKAESYYLLGGLESMLEQSFWLNEAQYYWENAIRILPHSSIAQKSFTALEAKVSEGFTGSGGVHIPDEIKNWLTSLKTLSSPKKRVAS